MSVCIASFAGICFCFASPYLSPPCFTSCTFLYFTSPYFALSHFNLHLPNFISALTSPHLVHPILHHFTSALTSPQPTSHLMHSTLHHLTSVLTSPHARTSFHFMHLPYLTLPQPLPHLVHPTLPHFTLAFTSLHQSYATSHQPSSPFSPHLTSCTLPCLSSPQPLPHLTSCIISNLSPHFVHPTYLISCTIPHLTPCILPCLSSPQPFPHFTLCIIPNLSPHFVHPSPYLTKPSFFRYLRTWFLIDLISSLPLDYIISAITHREDSELVGASRALRVLRLAKLLSLLRLLRVSRLVRYVSQYEVVSLFSYVTSMEHDPEVWTPEGEFWTNNGQQNLFYNHHKILWI